MIYTATVVSISVVQAFVAFNLNAKKSLSESHYLKTYWAKFSNSSKIPKDIWKEHDEKCLLACFWQAGIFVMLYL